jgi:Tfp pilus assembly protein FimT
MNQAQANELKALIGVARTRAVRYHLNRAGKGAPGETLAATLRGHFAARAALNQLIDDLTDKETRDE